MSENGSAAPQTGDLSSPPLADLRVQSLARQGSGSAGHPGFPVLTVLLCPPNAALSLWAP